MKNLMSRARAQKDSLLGTGPTLMPLEQDLTGDPKSGQPLALSNVNSAGNEFASQSLGAT
jgi:hypothetical protein